MINKVFFVYDQHAVARLFARPEVLVGCEVVISVVPGISLDSLRELVACCTLEDALQQFSITQRSISERASRYALALLERDACENAFTTLGLDEGAGVRVALLNHVALLLHNSFAFEFLFDTLRAQGMTDVVVFASSCTFRLVERLDIATLLHVEISFAPHLESLCREHGVTLRRVGAKNRMMLLRNALRNVLLAGYKAWVLLKRSWVAHAQPAHCDVVFVVRAHTEVAAAEPLLHWRAQQGKRDALLVDDLIKSPNGTQAACNSGYVCYPLHAFVSPWRFLVMLLTITLRSKRAARLAVAHVPGRLLAFGFLGQPSIAQQVMHTALATVPELALFACQLKRALAIIRPSALVSFDTVDRWGAVQGAVASAHEIRSVMVQNTAADDIFYPYPLATDCLVVSNERLQRVFLASGAAAERVHAFGLPLQDSVFLAGEARIRALSARAVSITTAPLRILVATQPFVQAFDYNGALLDDLSRVVTSLDFSVELVLKPHPRENLQSYVKQVEMLTKQGLNATLFDKTFEAALDVVDLVVSRTSTSLEFAALGGVPAIAYLCRYPSDIVERFDYLRDPVTIKAFCFEELRNTLIGFAPNVRANSMAVFRAKREAFVAEHFPGRGNATKRVDALIVAASKRVSAAVVERGVSPC